MKANTKYVIFTLLSFLVNGMAYAQSQTIGSVAETVTSSSGAIVGLVTGFAYLAGVVFAFKAALYFKDHTNNPTQVKLSKPITAMVIASCLLSLPSFLSSIEGTLGQATKCWSDSATGSEAGSTSGCITGGSAAPGAATDLAGMFVALSSSLPTLLLALTVAARIAGMFLLIKTLYMLPHLEQGRETPSKIIWTMIAGVGLWTFPAMTDTIMATMGASSSNSALAENPLLAKYQSASGSGFDDAIKSILMFVQFLGAIAFFRGILILKALGENKDGAMGRALTHIFGGAAALNITWAVAMLAKSIGASAQICGISTVMCAF